MFIFKRDNEWSNIMLNRWLTMFASSNDVKDEEKENIKLWTNV
jgi:hypothetical protein